MERPKDNEGAIAGSVKLPVAGTARYGNSPGVETRSIRMTAGLLMNKGLYPFDPEHAFGALQTSRSSGI